MRHIALFFIFVGTLLAAPEPALRDGEMLTYRVGWGIFFHAGEIRISAHTTETPGAAPQLVVTTDTETKGLTRALYTFEARADAALDLQSGRLLTYAETSTSPNKETKSSVVFDYAKSTADYVNALSPEKSAALPIPPGDPLDLIMSLVQTRTWDLKPGEQRDALVLFEDEFYELTIHADRYEEVHTPLGDFTTLVLVPRMEKTPPKGMFKKGSTVSVWISQDGRRLPVKFKVDFNFGAGVATLMRYQPPTGTVAKVEPDAKNPRS